MFRRAFLSLLPACLALVFLCGTPAIGFGGQEASATSWGAKSWGAKSWDAKSGGATGTAPAVVRGKLTQDVADVSVYQSADEDDTPDDRIARVVSAVVWPDPALDARFLRASDRAGPSHRPCAAPPRAPPTA
jgi:hypothetical protein